MDIKLDKNEIVTKLILYTLTAILAVGLHLIVTQSIDGYSELKEENIELRRDVNDLLALHKKQLGEEPEEESGLGIRIWRTVTFYELRK